MGLSCPADMRRNILSGCTNYEKAKEPFQKQYDAVIVDVSAVGRHLMAPFGSKKMNMTTIATNFVRLIMSAHPTAHSFVLCYDNVDFNPAIRSSMLHVNRYGPKLSEPPADMNPDTHVFLEGRVYSKHSAKLPASPDAIERATLTELHATIDAMLSSEAGKRKLLAIHAECVKRACETALVNGSLNPEATIIIVPPSGVRASVITAHTHAFEHRLSEYGEADMLIMVYAERALALGKKVLLRTIDTDAILQSALFTAGEAPGGVLDIHIANIYMSTANTVHSTSSKAGPKAVRCRELVDVCALKRELSIESQVLLLLYGGDYIKGLCIRGLGLPKKNLHDLIVRGTDTPFVTVSKARVVIDWSAFFRALAPACKAPSNTKVSADGTALNQEMQRIAYCVAYFSGIAFESGGPPVDERPVLLPGFTVPNILGGRGTAGSVEYTT